MTDYTELKPLLAACRAENCDGPREFRRAVEALFDVCTVETISALIAENEHLAMCARQWEEAAMQWGAERDQLKAENEVLRREREGKVLCDLELFETLRDSANTEADEHRQCMATYRPLRQENLDSVVKKCDDLLAAMGKGEQS